MDGGKTWRAAGVSGVCAMCLGSVLSMLANMSQRKPDPVGDLAGALFICCIEFVANAAVVCMQPEAYHFRMIQCAWEIHALSFSSHCND